MAVRQRRLEVKIHTKAATRFTPQGRRSGSFQAMGLNVVRKLRQSKSGIQLLPVRHGDRQRLD